MVVRQVKTAINDSKADILRVETIVSNVETNFETNLFRLDHKVDTYHQCQDDVTSGS